MFSQESIASLDVPFHFVGNHTDAWPAVLIHLSEIFHTFQISWEVFSFFMSSLLTDWVGFVDVIDAPDFEVVRAVGGLEVSEGEGKEGE